MLCIHVFMNSSTWFAAMHLEMFIVHMKETQVILFPYKNVLQSMKTISFLSKQIQ